MIVFGMDLGPHWAFIVWAYGLAAAVITLLVAWVVLDHRAQTRILADMEAQGLRRRSRRGADRSGQTP